MNTHIISRRFLGTTTVPRRYTRHYKLSHILESCNHFTIECLIVEVHAKVFFNILSFHLNDPSSFTHRSASHLLVISTICPPSPVRFQAMPLQDHKSSCTIVTGDDGSISHAIPEWLISQGKKVMVAYHKNAIRRLMRWATQPHTTPSIPATYPPFQTSSGQSQKRNQITMQESNNLLISILAIYNM